MGAQRVEWERPWGILYALSFPRDHAIYGKVKLNKVLAMLQRDGFPISNRFINMQMGPADPAIEGDAELLQGEKLIEIKGIPERVGKRAGDAYWLSGQGFQFVQRKLGPNVEYLPYQSVFKARLAEIKRDFEMFSVDEIVSKIHRELLIDASPEQLERETQSIKENLERIRESVERQEDYSCSICLELLGCSDFAIKSLSHVIRIGLDKRDSSKNLIYYNCKDLLHYALKLKDHIHAPDARFGLDSTSQLRENLAYRLYCLEEINGLYGIIEPIRDMESLGERLQALAPKEE